jgi:hypothetical protein
MSTDFNKILNDIQPLYDELNSRYSKSYLQGSSWYVGDDLHKWWKHCNNVRYFPENKQKLVHIIEILLIYKKNKKYI